MAKVIDFNVWLNDLDGDHEEVMALYEAVQDARDMGLYKCIKGDISGTWIVSAEHLSDEVFLKSSSEKNDFLKAIRVRFCDGEDVESWYGFERNMSNDRA